MKCTKLRIVSAEGTEATIETDGSQGGAADYFATVSVKGLLETKKVYGIDPLQSFSLGLNLISSLTEDRRIGKDGDDPMPGETWRIEIVND